MVGLAIFCMVCLLILLTIHTMGEFCEENLSDSADR